MRRTIMIMQTRRTSASGERDERMLPDRDGDRRDEAELGDVRDAVRDGLGRRVDRVAKPELRGVRGDGEPAAEQRGDEHDHADQRARRSRRRERPRPAGGSGCGAFPRRTRRRESSVATNSTA